MVPVMPKEERKRLVLQFLVDYPLALPKRPIFENMKMEMKITVTEETIGQYLDELVNEDNLEELDIGNGYYRITDAGREYLET